MKGAQLELWYGPELVGFVFDPWTVVGDWYGDFQMAAGVPVRIRGFIELSVDWHRRHDAGEKPALDELSPWADVYRSDRWRAVNLAGVIMRIESPMFRPGGEVYWQAAEQG